MKRRRRAEEGAGEEGAGEEEYDLDACLTEGDQDVEVLLDDEDEADTFSDEEVGEEAMDRFLAAAADDDDDAAAARETLRAAQLAPTANERRSTQRVAAALCQKSFSRLALARRV